MVASRGYQFAVSSPREFHDPAGCAAALKERRENRAVVPASVLRRIDLDGRVNDEDLRFTESSFRELCKASGIPPSYLLKLAKRNDSLAHEVLSDALGSTFPADDMVLTIDSSARLIESVASPHSYIDASEVLDLLLSANSDFRLTRAWIHGQQVRFALATSREVDVKKGDAVCFGVSVEHDESFNAITHIADYVERLVCDNGMTTSDRKSAEEIHHAEEVATDLIFAACAQVADRSRNLLPLMKAAATSFYDANGIRSARSFLQHAPGGGRALEVRATRGAVEEARREGHPPGAISVWNYVNGVTDAAKQEPTPSRRRSVEALGHALLQRSADS